MLIGLVGLCFAEAGRRVAGALARFFLDTLARVWLALGDSGAGIALLEASYATLALVNIAGTRDGTRLSVVLGMLKLMPLLAIIGLGVFTIQPANLAWPAMPPVSKIGARPTGETR